MIAPGYVEMPPPGTWGQPDYFQAPPQRQLASVPQQQQRPVVRGVAPEEKKPVVRREPVTLPSPDQLGIQPIDPTIVDWNATMTRMKTMGVLEFGMGRVEGGYRFSVVMATSEPGRTYRIDGTGANEADAVRVCLDKTHRWLYQTP